jgi:predicted HicB family RNase H-like nuclease
LMTLRLPPEFLAEAKALAERYGISLNALVAIALRSYLDSKR